MNITFGFVFFLILSLLGFIGFFRKSKSIFGWGSLATWETGEKNFYKTIFGKNFIRYANLMWAIINLLIAIYILWVNNK